jgi:hypothetical protein
MAPEKSFDGAWLTWELLLLQSPTTAPEKSLMSMHASILLESVRPPSAEVCKTAASFPYVDHPRFIELREEEVKGIPLKQPCN